MKPKLFFNFLILAIAFLSVPALASVNIPGPHELPDPDASSGATDKAVKVYIMSGQSNMVGFGRIGGTDPGTLETITGAGLFPHLVDDTSGGWTTRNDVLYRGVISATGNDKLKPGFGAGNGISDNIGPELGFGHVMGYFHDEPVLLIKSSIGNRSLSWDCAPPSTVRFEYNGMMYAGYGDYGNWAVGEEPPTTGGWFAGYEWDRFFLDEADFSPSAATVGLTSVFNVVDILDNFATEYPQWASQGFEIAGFVWWQGHKDQSAPHSSRYEQNMVNFIKDIRAYYENRYPNNFNSNAPFVLATVAFDGGWSNTSTHFLNIANGQLAVSDPDKHPEFEGSVATAEARGFWRDSIFSPSTAGYHYNHNAETYMLVGDALGRAMAELIPAYSINAGQDMVTWDGQEVSLSATVESGVAVTSYEWTAYSSNPGDTIVFDPAVNPTYPNSSSSPNPTITITRSATGPAKDIIVKLKVEDGVNDPVLDVMTIQVHDDACKATRLGLGLKEISDINLDCVTTLEDFALLASSWVNFTGLQEPQVKP